MLGALYNVQAQQAEEAAERQVLVRNRIEFALIGGTDEHQLSKGSMCTLQLLQVQASTKELTDIEAENKVTTEVSS